MLDQSKGPIRLNEYTKELLEKRKQEVIKEDIINHFNERQGEGLTSPTTLTTTEETRLFMEYMDRANLLNISNRNKEIGKALTLRKFFKSKRNQQVEVYSRCGTEPIYTEGKVSAIGRDFVMLTNLKDRIWIPYKAIESANIPFGIPNYSNTHQHFIYDNDLRKKLLQNFGETVAKKDVLKQQFYEESLQTNLNSWKDSWVEVYLDGGLREVGKIKELRKDKLVLVFFGKIKELETSKIQYIETLRWLGIFKYSIKNLINL